MPDKSKLKIIFAVGIFSIIWNIFILSIIIPYLSNQNPIIQYLLYNIGSIGLWFAIAGTILTGLRTSYNFKEAFIDGITAFFLFSFVFDMWEPPFAYDAQGKVLISDPKSLIGASVDQVWGYIFTTIFPQIQNTMIPLLNISFLYIAVYVLVPMAWIIISSIILTRGELLSRIQNGFGGINVFSKK